MTELISRSESRAIPTSAGESVEAGRADIFLANIQALWQRWPRLAQQVERIDELDFVPCQASRSGALTCQVEGPNQQPVYLHSRYDPVKEAERWAEGAIQQGQQQQDRDDSCLAMCYIVDGFGLGYHVRALFEQLPGDAFIVVSEPDVALIRTALDVLDMSEMLRSGRMIFITNTNRDEIFHQVQRQGTAMMLGIVFTRALQRTHTEFHQQVHTTITEYASYMRTHLVSVMTNCILTCKNILHNLPSYVGTSSIGILQNRFQGYPAVLVSAGPSLTRNIEYLKEIRDKVVVIAVQTTLKPLLKRGIVPDFVTSLDYSPISKRFFEGLTDGEKEWMERVHLVAEPKATWHVIDCYRQLGPMSLLGNDFAGLCLKELGDRHEKLKAGATVAHLSFYLAEYLGADPIVLLGQDLGYTHHVYYSPGNALHDLWAPELNRFCTIEMKEWERIARYRNMLRKTKDDQGREMYTDEQMFTYLQQFEKDFAESAARVIDATEGGVSKQFCQPMSLREAAEQFCHKVIDPEKFAYRCGIRPFQSDRLEKAKECVEKRIEQVQELKAISEETIKLVKEMLELVDQQDKLNRKMIRLDELRMQVKNRDEVYRLVMHVAQSAEMFRFRQDRSLELGGSEGKERQRQQLRRDIAYVSQVAQGCDVLEELFQECLGRFEQEIQ